MDATNIAKDVMKKLLSLLNRAVAPAKSASSTALAASLVAKATGGTVYAIWGYSSNVGAQFIQIHNTATLPANGEVPIVTLTVAATSNFYFEIGAQTGLLFDTGITLCNSSTSATKTIGAADTWFNVAYK